MKRFQTIVIFILITVAVYVAGARFFRSVSGSSISDFLSPKDNFTSVVYTVEEGDTWGTVSKNLRLSSEVGSALLAASEEAHSLADLRAGNPLELRFDKKTNELLELRYDINDSDLLIIRKNKIDDNTSEFVASNEKIKYNITLAARRGVIDNSLFETAVAAGVPEGIILDMAWIFSWDIDFNTAIRTGDSFRVIYEERTRDGKSVGPGRVLAAQFVNDGKEFSAFYYVDPDGDGQYRGADGSELKRQFLRAPLDYRRISSGYTTKRYVKVLRYFGSHRAIDYAAAIGTPVSATADGTVTFVGWKNQHGKHIEIKHGNGYATGYSHLSAYAKGLRVGKKVKQNEIIGFVGSTGLSTGAHLHYEMRKNGTLINPLRLDLPPGKPLKDEYRSDFEAKKAKLLTLLKSIK